MTAAQVVKPGATVLFARAGYTGSQASVTGRFTGDQHRSWDRHTGIGSVLPAMLSGSISGWPYWGPDIAGAPVQQIPLFVRAGSDLQLPPAGTLGLPAG